MANDIFAQALAIAALNNGGGTGAVSSVNGQTGVVVLDADDVGAVAEGTTSDYSEHLYTFTSSAQKTDKVILEDMALASSDSQIPTALAVKTAIDNKQSSLAEGDGIDISQNVISVDYNENQLQIGSDGLETNLGYSIGESTSYVQKYAYASLTDTTSYSAGALTISTATTSWATTDVLTVGKECKFYYAWNDILPSQSTITAYATCTNVSGGGLTNTVATFTVDSVTCTSSASMAVGATIVITKSPLVGANLTIAGTLTQPSGYSLTTGTVSLKQTTSGVISQMRGDVIPVDGSTITLTNNKLQANYTSYHDSTKQDTLDSTSANANVIAPLYVDTGELRINLGNGVYKTSDDVLEAKPGTGITVDASGINVDTTVIQPKLTAGTNITIDQTTNTISASGGGSSISGVANGTGTNSLIIGYQKDSNEMYSRGYGSVAVGSVNSWSGNYIQANACGGFAGGYVTGSTDAGTNIQAGQTGNTTPNDVGAGEGCFAFGSAKSGGKILASGDQSSVAGAAALGYAYYGTITAKGDGSLAVGYAGRDSSSTIDQILTTGTGSQAFGRSTQALSNYQHVIGKYNTTDSASTYAFIIGNGTDNSNRSNALTVDWNGNLVCTNIPAPPSTDGTYNLQCSIVSGVVTYSWVAQA